MLVDRGVSHWATLPVATQILENFPPAAAPIPADALAWVMPRQPRDGADRRAEAGQLPAPLVDGQIPAHSTLTTPNASKEMFREVRFHYQQLLRPNMAAPWRARYGCAGKKKPAANQVHAAV